MSKLTAYLPRVRFWLFVSLVIGMPLSKYPSIALPMQNFTSFRLGLYQILAVIFVLLCVWPALLKLKNLYKQNRLALISIITLGLVVLFRLFWTLDKSRSVLLAVSICFLLSLIVVGWWYVRYELPRNKYSVVVKCLLWGGIVYGGLSVIQFIVGTFSNSTLGIACQGCTNDIFGFPRVNLFAAEPQFFANALLVFFFTALAVCYKKPGRLALFSLSLTTLAIGLTFSRGAYIALIIGLISFGAFSFYGKFFKPKRFLQLLALMLVLGLASLGLMIASASWRYRNTPNIAYNTTSTILEHTSLGFIKLPAKTISPEKIVLIDTTAETDNNFTSPGLIEASTNDRLGAAELALKAWSSNPTTALVGVGAGNLGPFVVANVDSSAPSNLTVYIFYVLVLAELGVVGLAAFLLIYLCGLYSLLKLTKKLGLVSIAAASLIIAFGTQYFFFGTYINAVFVWLSAGVALGISVKQKELN